MKSGVRVEDYDMAPARRLDHDAIATDYLNRPDLTVAEIADLHGCYQHTVTKIVMNQGLSGTRNPPLDHDTIAKDYIAGELLIREIAEVHGCDVWSIYKLARQRGLKRQGGPASLHAD